MSDSPRENLPAQQNAHLQRGGSSQQGRPAQQNSRAQRDGPKQQDRPTQQGGLAGSGSDEDAVPAPLSSIMAADWAEALAPVEPQIRQMGDFLRAENAAGRSYLPAGSDIFRAFAEPLANVRVLIVGQDPYPTPGHPIGLSFAVAPEVRPIPRSLQNIYAELRDDLGTEPPDNGDLRPWSHQGVMLLNRCLTVRPGTPASHRGKGWEAVTDRAIEVLVERGGPLTAILWGRDARSLKPALRSVPTVESAHPSPLSAARGFFGSRPFSRTNDLLIQQGADPVDWRLQS